MFESGELRADGNELSGGGGDWRAERDEQRSRRELYTEVAAIKQGLLGALPQYLGAFLGHDERAALLDQLRERGFIPEGAEPNNLDHVTTVFFPGFVRECGHPLLETKLDVAKQWEDILAKKVRYQLTEWVIDRDEAGKAIVCARVEMLGVTVPMGIPHPHITIEVDEGRAPIQSNFVLAEAAKLDDGVNEAEYTDNNGVRHYLSRYPVADVSFEAVVKASFDNEATVDMRDAKEEAGVNTRIQSTTTPSFKLLSEAASSVCTGYDFTHPS